MRTHILYLSLVLLSCGGMPETSKEGKAGGAGAPGTQGAMGAPGRDAVAAGSRLRPLSLVGADGSRAAVLYFRDTKTGKLCFPQPMSGDIEGEWACAAIGGKPAPDDVRFSMQ